MDNYFKENKAVPSRLVDKVNIPQEFTDVATDENVWIDVIQKMDTFYADLVISQIELENKNAELENAQKFIGSILASMTDVLIACNNKGVIEQVNPAFETLIGVDKDKIKGKSLIEAFGEKNKKKISSILNKLKARENLTDYEVQLTDKKGEPVLLALNCSIRYNYRGQALGMVIIGRPIGELRAAYENLDKAHHKLRDTQQQLVFSEKMAALGRLVAGVAHELNNPISFVFGNMHALKRYGTNITKYLNYANDKLIDEESIKLKSELKIDNIVKDILPLVEGTLEGAHRVSDIVQDLRRFSGSQIEPKEVFDIIPVIETATRWVARTSKKKIKIKFENMDSNFVIAREGHVHQIIVNLAQNAIDMSNGSEVIKLEVSVDSDNKYAGINIRDFGPGIKKKDIERIFEPFYTTKETGQGMGLGLYISFGLAKEQGGILSAKNHPDNGAVFSLKIPLAKKVKPQNSHLRDEIGA